MCIMTCHCNEKSNNLIIIYSQCLLLVPKCKCFIELQGVFGSGVN